MSELERQEEIAADVGDHHHFTAWSPDGGFPIADPVPEPVMISRPCGCTSMTVDDDQPPVQISWCDEHDPGYPAPNKPAPLPNRHQEGQ